MKFHRWASVWPGLIFSILLLTVSAIPAGSQNLAGKDLAIQDLVFKIPPVKSSFNIGSQPIAITASGVVSGIRADRNQAVFKLKLTADLSELQQNITGLLQSELDRSDRCGERIAIQHATLIPASPASRAVVDLHYESWKCAKLLGKQVVTKLAGGNGEIQVRLTPAVEEGAAVRLEPEIEDIQADGPLGDLLRSGQFGAALRQKIGAALLATMQKGTSLSATLPPAIQNFVTLLDVRFRDAGSGRLSLTMAGEVRISPDQIPLLRMQLRDRAQ